MHTSRIPRATGLLQSDTERHQSGDQDAHERDALQVRDAVLQHGRRGASQGCDNCAAPTEAARHRAEIDGVRPPDAATEAREDVAAIGGR